MIKRLHVGKKTNKPAEGSAANLPYDEVIHFPIAFEGLLLGYLVMHILTADREPAQGVKNRDVERKMSPFSSAV